MPVRTLLVALALVLVAGGAGAAEMLVGETFTVSPASDRVGMRLRGPRLPGADEGTRLSEPMVRGAVQVPSSGEAIVLGPDHPTMGGYPVLEHFRDKPQAPPIIMITANEGSRHKAYAEYLGVIDYIRKPFAMERLLEAVDRALTQSEQAAAKKSEKTD